MRIPLLTRIREAFEGKGSGHVRLVGALTGYEAEFQCLADEAMRKTGATTEGDDEAAKPCWVTKGEELFGKARSALDEGEIEKGWYYLHAAKRLEIYGIEAVDRKVGLQSKAREILAEAEDAPQSWRTEAVRRRLTDDDGSLRMELSDGDLRSARTLLDEGYERVHLKRKHLQAQFSQLRVLAVVTTVIFFALAWWGEVGGFVPSPFLASDAITVETVGFSVYVLLAGVLGASLFGMRSLRRQPTSGRAPQHLTGGLITSARVVVGAISALFVFFFLRAGLLTVGVGSEVEQAQLFIALAFVAGYSERLVPRTVETVAGATEPPRRTEGGP